MSARASTSSPRVIRLDTGCSVTLSSSLVPAHVSHNPKLCQCILASHSAGDDEPEHSKIARMASSVRAALEEGIMYSEKPAVCFARLLLGGQVVYEDRRGRSRGMESFGVAGLAK
ncbi:hypothetical protein F4808DRAFT_458961 [Astrocystis sublimbata]|nr:hypothetical protein F4808DRAFT_458961 [Astrocystis sublimbata]